MKRSRFTDSQVIAILKEAESGVSVPNLCSKHSMSDATLADFSEQGVNASYTLNRPL